MVSASVDFKKYFLAIRFFMFIPCNFKKEYSKKGLLKYDELKCESEFTFLHGAFIVMSSTKMSTHYEYTYVRI
ncbi:hypothetical protein PspMM1_06980 [Pseudoalteromonas sp. MM1]|nr:hypothetical protein PspMM1_06980 [Pseudoalteromonas sp. MM1]